MQSDVHFALTESTQSTDLAPPTPQRQFFKKCSEEVLLCDERNLIKTFMKFISSIEDLNTIKLLE